MTTQTILVQLTGKVRMNDHNHADTLQGASGTASPEASPTLVVGSQYLRTLSIDVQNTPDIYRDIPAQPHVGMTVDVTARQLPGGQPSFEVTLVIRAQGLDAAPVENAPAPRVLYEVHIAYAGLFGLSGAISQATAEPLLLVEAPKYLFPSARAAMLNVVREAGFPVGNIQPINFHDLWQSRRLQQG